MRLIPSHVNQRSRVATNGTWEPKSPINVWKPSWMGSKLVVISSRHLVKDSISSLVVFPASRFSHSTTDINSTMLACSPLTIGPQLLQLFVVLSCLQPFLCEVIDLCHGFFLVLHQHLLHTFPACSDRLLVLTNAPVHLLKLWNIL